MNKLDKLRGMTVIVADTGDLAEIEKLNPYDATTNPSLLLRAAKDPDNAGLLGRAIAKNDGDVGNAADAFGVMLGVEILKRVPGRVSTEIDARLSFDCEAMISKARKLIRMYASSRTASWRSASVTKYGDR